jgi:hypothetical protein
MDGSEHTSVSIAPYSALDTHTDGTDIRPQTAWFYNECKSTDPSLVTWRSAVYEPPWGWFHERPKHVGANVKCFNMRF